LKYKNISIKLPSRIDDGYGMKSYHMDQMKDIGVDLVITVDNGITAMKEVEYANKI
jgi:single-stranded-DNA-specific exonuclease